MLKKPMLKKPSSQSPPAPLLKSSLDSPGHETLVIDLKSDFTLICHYMSKLGWQEKQFSARKSRVLIGNNPYEAQINIPEGDSDSIQAVAQKVDDAWLIMETGKVDLMSVDGFPRRQAVIHKQGKSVVVIGQTAMVFRAGTIGEEKPPFLPEGQRAMIRVGLHDFSYAFGKPFLLGNHPSCELRTDQLFADQKAEPTLKAVFDAPFLAVLCSHGDRMFLSPIGGVNLRLNGEPVTTAVPLPPSAAVSIDKLTLPINLPEGLRGKEFGVPNLREDRFALLQFDDQGKVVGKVDLHKPGHSMIVGRAAQGVDIIIPLDEVSRKHAQMILYDKNILLEDCYSSNGTFVNDEMVGRSRIRAGDFVRFGTTQQFLLCYADPVRGEEDPPAAAE